MKRIAIITSGGDSPGMNAAIRSVVRTAIFHDIECFGFYRGYQGVIENEYIRLEIRSVSKILGMGGTLLKSARSLDFHKPEIREKAFANLKALSIDALIVIGGNGSLTGASIFSDQFDFPVIGIPASIDNDVYGSDHSIGFHTSLDTIIDSVDKIRDTARSHNRLFFVEVMGRDSGNLALHSSVASGACYVIIPEKDFTIKGLANRLEEGNKLNKTSSIVIVAEGNKYGPSYKIAEDLSNIYSEYETKVTILGHLQRGGSPSCSDRILASKLGKASIDALLDGEKHKMVGVIKNEIVLSDLKTVIDNKNGIDESLFYLNEIISR
ncbi:MAG: 6-phosphofructokinase [Flavobacteriales bacterium]|jgi:6-phosphofructokinase 1|tara:strand:+ start:16809 stop:17780 length:972 start_codon:yes stop_codon:yes gene_type:complete